MKLFKKESKGPSISRAEALDRIPDRNVQISEECLDSGEIVIHYPVTMRPLFAGLVKRFGGPGVQIRTKKLQLDALGTSVWALIDTGAQAPLMTTEDKARELGIAIDRSGERREYVNVLGRTLNTVQLMPEATLGPLTLKNVPIVISIKEESTVRVQRWLQDQTILGIEILENYRVRFDYARQKMGLTPIHRSEPAEEAPQSSEGT